MWEVRCGDEVEEDEGGGGGIVGHPKQTELASLMGQLTTPLVTGQCASLQICAAGGRNNTGLKKHQVSKMQRKVFLPENVNQALLSFSILPVSLAVRSVSDFVVDVGRALRGHLLDNVDGVAIVAAHLLIVRAVVVLCPQRNDDVTGLRASRAPGHLGIGQRAERQRRRAGLRVGIFPGALAHLDEQDDEEEDEHEEDDAAGPDG